MTTNQSRAKSARTSEELRLSYKFQRLREQLRQAVTSGEWSGKLPGERELAKRFGVNAKTLGKALTDLAAEGLLERSIGRGTYVKGAAPPPTTNGRWLIIAGAADKASPIVRHLCAAHQDCEIRPGVRDARPSFVNQFSAVIDLAADTPETFLRDMRVRGVPTVIVGREPKTYSMNCVLMDRALGVARLTRDLLIAGHRRFCVVASRRERAILDAAQKAATAFDDASVDPCDVGDVSAALESGVTALLCDCALSAQRVMESLRSKGVDVPGRVSVAAVGQCDGPHPCTGYYVTAEAKAQAILTLLEQTHRPTTLWLAGDFADTGTTATTSAPIPGDGDGNGEPSSIELAMR